MNSFRDRFAGEKCVIFGNGPSLTLELIEQINKSNLFTFSVNGFCLLFHQTDFRPSCVCMENYSAIQTYGPLYSSAVIKFFKFGWEKNVPNPKDYKNIFNIPFLCSHDLGYHKSLFIKDGNFSINPFKENYCGDTVILDFAIPLAFYMGFRKIILCGVDTDYSIGHFNKNYINAQNSNNINFKSMLTGDYSIAVPGYRYSKKFLLSRGREIYKLTKSKRLNFIETINFDDILTETD